VSSKCFQLYYTCSDRLLTIALPSYSFHLFPPLTVTFPKLSVILCHYKSAGTAVRKYALRHLGRRHQDANVSQRLEQRLRERLSVAPMAHLNAGRLRTVRTTANEMP
jgi:hypothetical protein